MKFIFEVHIKDGHSAEEYAEFWIQASEQIQQAEGARGTELCRKIGDDRVLIAIASWVSKEQRDAMEQQPNDVIQTILEKAASIVDIKIIGEFEEPEWAVFPEIHE